MSPECTAWKAGAHGRRASAPPPAAPARSDTPDVGNRRPIRRRKGRRDVVVARLQLRKHVRADAPSDSLRRHRSRPRHQRHSLYGRPTRFGGEHFPLHIGVALGAGAEAFVPSGREGSSESGGRRPDAPGENATGHAGRLPSSRPVARGRRQTARSGVPRSNSCRRAPAPRVQSSRRAGFARQSLDGVARPSASPSSVSCQSDRRGRARDARMARADTPEARRPSPPSATPGCLPDRRIPR